MAHGVLNIRSSLYCSEWVQWKKTQCFTWQRPSMMAGREQEGRVLKVGYGGWKYRSWQRKSWKWQKKTGHSRPSIVTRREQEDVVLEAELGGRKGTGGIAVTALVMIIRM